MYICMYLQFKIQITLMALNFSAVRYNHNSQTGFEHEEMRYAYLVRYFKMEPTPL